jgi:F-type H+-transporting ATPase subunit delta
VTSAPQISSIISGRYAASLIDLAEQAKLTDKVEQDLETLQSMISASSDLASMIRSPLINRAEQTNALNEIAARAKFQQLTQNFLGVLVQNRRISTLENILRAARSEFSRRRGEQTANVVTASALTPEQTRALQDAISKAVGSDVFLEAKVDPEILGGMIVTVGSRMIDDSVRRKLERLRSAMTRQSNQNVQTVEEVA